MNQKQFLETVNNPALARAVIRQLGGWDSFKESAPDITNHGISGGFHGFIYYTDTCGFTRKNRAAIASMVETMADDLGESPLDMVAGFNCLKESVTASEVGRVLYSGRGGDPDARQLIENALAWFAGEEISRAYQDAIE